MAVAYSYIRFSTPEQSKGDSLRRQTEGAAEWCEQNGVSLDTRTYRDLGVSGYTGKHRQNPARHGLALFLSAVQGGKVPAGSYLVLENLDRLTREHVRAAYGLFNSILDAGIHIVQLSPERVFKADATGSEAMFDVIVALMELGRGNSEIAIKSDRIAKNWRQRRQAIREGKGGHLPGRPPFWVDKTDRGYALNERAEIVRRVFRYALEGCGSMQTQRRLRQELDVELSKTYLQQLLRDRIVLGVLEDPRTRHEPLAVYPPAVPEQVFDAVQAGLTARTNRPKDGRPRSRDGKTVYLFNSLMADARRPVSGFNIGKQANGRGVHKYVLVAYLTGRGHCHSFPVGVFEAALLGSLSEIDPRDVVADRDDGAGQVLALTGRVESLTRRIEQAEAELDDGDLKVLAKKLRQWTDEKAEAEQALAAAKARVASPTAEAWAELWTLLGRAADPAETALRLKVRAAVRRAVTRMTCLFIGTTRWRMAWVQVEFADTGYRRHVNIIHRSKGNRHQPADTCETTFTMKPGYDLVANLADAERTLEWLVEDYVRNGRPPKQDRTAPPAG